MTGNVRHEEVTAFGDFVFTSYERDLDVIKSKFPKLGETFKDAFIAKLDFVKKLESSLMLNENRKSVTTSLYAEAKVLDKELNFLSSYFTDAGLNPSIVSELKADLHNHNIEGAILKLERMSQFVGDHEVELVAEGMPAAYGDILLTYKDNLVLKNKEQNALLNSRKQLTDVNLAHYEALLKMIKKITSKGKLVFKGTVTEDEYINKKVLQRMRATKRKEEDGKV